MNFLRYLLQFWSYEAKCVRLGCFRKGQPLCTQILPGQDRPPSTILGIRKLGTGLPDGENRIPLCYLVLTQYRSVTDGQTDKQMGRRTDMP